MHRLVKFQY